MCIFPIASFVEDEYTEITVKLTGKQTGNENEQLTLRGRVPRLSKGGIGRGSREGTRRIGAVRRQLAQHEDATAAQHPRKDHRLHHAQVVNAAGESRRDHAHDDTVVVVGLRIL